MDILMLDLVPSTDKIAAQKNGAALVRVRIWPKPYHTPYSGIGVRGKTWKMVGSRGFGGQDGFMMFLHLASKMH